MTETSKLNCALGCSFLSCLLLWRLFVIEVVTRASHFRMTGQQALLHRRGSFRYWLSEGICVASYLLLLAYNPSTSFIFDSSPPKCTRIFLVSKTVSKDVGANLNVSISTASSSLSLSLSSTFEPRQERKKQSWNPANSLGALLLRTKKLEEGHSQNKTMMDSGWMNHTSTDLQPISKASVNIGRVQIIDQTRPRNNNRSPLPGIPLNIDTSAFFSGLSFMTTGNIDKEQAKELDEAVTILPFTRDMIMRDIKILDSPTSLSKKFMQDIQNNKTSSVVDVPSKKRRLWRTLFQKPKSNTEPIDGNSVEVEAQTLETLPLSDPEHTKRIEMDMRHLAVTIGSSIDSAAQWKLYCDNGGSILPMLQCIMDAASTIEEVKTQDFTDDNSISLISEKLDVMLTTASAACKTLRDLSTISKALSVVITDEILRYDAAWSKTKWPRDKELGVCRVGGIISAMLILLRNSFETDAIYDRHLKIKTNRLLATNRKLSGSRRQRKEARRRCGLYVLQLLYSMAFASDDAINTFRATSAFVDSVLACSSFAQKEQLRRRWVRYPIELLKRTLFRKSTDKLDPRNTRNAFLAAASVADGLTGQIQAAANQILAAIGYNVWVPKIPGQRGLRILSLDGGGTRGITAISTLRAIVGAMGGIEVCDSFDMIVGTSTGAIIAFLVGLRRESSQMAKRRYDRLIRRIFVKSALSTPMLVFTTATYDETPFNAIMEEILLDNSMLTSRVDPRVPFVFAVSSKMGTTPTQLCLFRNYNYSGGEKRDPFVMSPEEARTELGLAPFTDISISTYQNLYEPRPGTCVSRNTEASRHIGSFRVLQRVALRASTAAPTVFKPVKMGGDLFCDGGIGASNPTAVAIHEARILFPNIPIEMVVSCGTGAFVEESSAPRIGWDGIISQIIMSATDCEQTHHILEDILGQGGTVQGRSSISQTKYYRFNPVVGTAENFPIDNTDPVKLEELNDITTRYMKEPTQARKLQEISAILDGQSWWKKIITRYSSKF